MGKLSGCLIVSDIDGTLYNKDYICPENNIRAIEYFKEEGGLFTLASGRSLYNVSIIGEELCNTYFIGFNGSAIGRLRDVKCAFPLRKGFYKDIAPLLEKIPFADAKFLTPRGTYVYNPNEYTEIHKSYITEKEMTEIKDLKDAPDDTLMIAMWMSEDKIPLATQAAESLGLMEKYEFVKGFRLAFELVPKGFGKGKAATVLKEMTGCHTLITAGDNFNDISMLQAADCSFAPKNAVDEIKAFATVSLETDCNEGIFPDIIKFIEENLK